MEMSEKKYSNPIPTIDAIIHNNNNQILLIKRKNEPFKNYFALPGGFVNKGEKIEDALRREVNEEVSLNVEPLEILGVYSDPNRDPRDHIMTIVFICLILDETTAKAEDDASALCWINLNELKNIEMAFDHKMIVEDYLNWRNNNSTYWSSKMR